MPPRILVTGGDGMLAWDLVRTFRKQFSVESVLALGRGELDITSKESIRSVFSAVRPTWVFNTAAYTSVDGAEGEKEKAEAINAEGPAFLADACRASGARLVHFGTDQVFDGRAQAPRTEAEIPVPSNHYAATKLRGEQAVLQNKGNLVLRVQWLYGEKKDRFSVLRQKKEFSPFSDQVGAPTWTREIARVLVALMERESEGLFHFSYDDHASWADVFEFVKAQWDLDVVLKPKRTEEVKLPANRPLFSVLSNEKLKNELGLESMGSWKAPLQEFLSLSVGKV